MGAWQNDGSLSKYTTAPNTRSLSVTSNLQAISNATGNNPSYDQNSSVTTTMAVLFYERPNASVAVLSRFAQGCSENLCPYYDSENPIYTGDVRNSSWIDNSTSLREACQSSVDPSQTSCDAPFVSSQYRNNNSLSVMTYFCQKGSSEPSVLETVFSPLENSEDSGISFQSKYR